VGSAARASPGREVGTGILVRVGVGSGDEGPVDDARAALDDGQAWRARDILAEHVEHEHDPDAMALLGQVFHDMGDLPRAGAVWFAAGVKGPEVDRAVAAWREQSRDDFAVMWRTLPASARQEPRARRVEALREKAIALEPTEVEDDDAPASDDDDEDGTDAAQVIAWILAAVFVVLAVIGAVTVLDWIWPE
jgi:hypothetical protein